VNDHTRPHEPTTTPETPPALLDLIEHVIENHDGHAIAYHRGIAYPIRFHAPEPATPQEGPHSDDETGPTRAEVDALLLQVQRDKASPYWQGRRDILDAVETYLESLRDWLPEAPNPEAPTPEPRLRIENGWLVREVDYHTCGAGDEHGHEPGCGLLPELHLANLPGWPTDDARADVLAAHQVESHGATSSTPDRCTCGEDVPPEPDPTTEGPGVPIEGRRRRAFAAHQARALAAARPSVTDNARARCVRDCTMFPGHSGPCCICGPGSATCKPSCPDHPDNRAAARADRPAGCCGVCPPIAGGGYDCTCEGNPRCSETTTATTATTEDIQTLDARWFERWETEQPLADKYAGYYQGRVSAVAQCREELRRLLATDRTRPTDTLDGPR